MPNTAFEVAISNERMEEEKGLFDAYAMEPLGRYGMELQFDNSAPWPPWDDITHLYFRRTSPASLTRLEKYVRGKWYFCWSYSVDRSRGQITIKESNPARTGHRTTETIEPTRLDPPPAGSPEQASAKDIPFDPDKLLRLIAEVKDLLSKNRKWEKWKGLYENLEIVEKQVRSGDEPNRAIVSRICKDLNAFRVRHDQFPGVSELIEMLEKKAS